MGTAGFEATSSLSVLRRAGATASHARAILDSNLQTQPASTRRRSFRTRGVRPPSALSMEIRYIRPSDLRRRKGPERETPSGVRPNTLETIMITRNVKTVFGTAAAVLALSACATVQGDPRTAANAGARRCVHTSHPAGKVPGVMVRCAPRNDSAPPAARRGPRS